MAERSEMGSLKDITLMDLLNEACEAAVIISGSVNDKDKSNSEEFLIIGVVGPEAANIREVVEKRFSHMSHGHTIH
jgi:hypothetical protein